MQGTRSAHQRLCVGVLTRKGTPTLPMEKIRRALLPPVVALGRGLTTLVAGWATTTLAAGGIGVGSPII